MFYSTISSRLVSPGSKNNNHKNHGSTYPKDILTPLLSGKNNIKIIYPNGKRAEDMEALQRHLDKLRGLRNHQSREI